MWGFLTRPYQDTKISTKWNQEVNYIDLPAAFNKYDGSFLFLIKKGIKQKKKTFDVSH